MAIKSAIEKYKRNIISSCYLMKPYEMIGCGSSDCSCVSGIIWDDIKFSSELGLQVANGYKYRLSCNLHNELYELLLEVIQPSRLNQTMSHRNCLGWKDDNDKKREKIKQRDNKINDVLNGR